MQSSNNILVVRNLVKKVDAVDTASSSVITILNGIQLEIKRSESVSIIGASGSGKSTLLGLLAGLDKPSEGSIIIDDINITELDEDSLANIRARKIGFIFQSFQLLPGMTALENVMLPLELLSENNARQRALYLLDRVGLGERLHHYPKQLSGGEQQRVAIARAFTTQPELLFADEPTGNLDKTTGQSIISLLFELNMEQGTTLIIVTHDDNLASRCERCLLLDSGRLTNVQA